MAVRQVLIYGDTRLHQKAEPVEKIDDEILEIIDDMYETMIEYKGIGLAAPQIGIHKAIITIDIGEHDEEVPMFAMINPKIIETNGSSVIEEGCLSIPGINAEVERPDEIKVHYTAPDGQDYEMECGGILARVIQHEHDHLEGILFPQRLESNEKKKIKPQLRKLVSDGAVA